MSVLIPIGYSFFDQKKYINPALTKALIMKRKQVLYEKQNWKIYEDQFEKKWKIIFESMFQAYVARLLLDNNRYEKIIMSLIHTKFTRLKQINLQNNNIVSLDSFYKIDMPQIQCNNLISSIKSLRKNSCKKIQYIGLCNNKISDLRYLADFNSNKLKKLALQWFDDTEICHYLNWICKLKTKQLKFIRIQSQQTMKNYRLDSMIEQQFPNINLCRFVK